MEMIQELQRKLLEITGSPQVKVVMEPAHYCCKS